MSFWNFLDGFDKFETSCQAAHSLFGIMNEEW